MKMKILLSLAIFIVVIGSGYLVWAAPDIWNGLGKKVPVSASYENKIVYTADQDADVELLRRDCEKRRGVFNICGTICAPDAQACAQICAYTCEFGQGNEKWSSYYNKDLNFSIEYPAQMKIIENKYENSTDFILSCPSQESTSSCKALLATVKKVPYQDVHNLEQLSWLDMKRSERTSKIFEYPKKVSIGGGYGYAYTAGIVGATANIYLPMDYNNYIKILYNFAYPADSNTQNIIIRMSSSFALVK